MSQAKGQAIAVESFTEADVGSYLNSHPDFFERHLPLLRRMRLPHESGGETISLVERQVSVLRKHNDELERKLTELFDVARANNQLVDNIHKLSVAFIRASSLDLRLEALESALREDFGAERAVLVLFNDASPSNILRPGFVKRLDRDDPALKSFSTFLKSARSRCGTLRERQNELLFDRESDSITSAAMVPIGEGARLGFLTVGSKNADQFHPGQQVDFLDQLGELVALALECSDERDLRD